MRRVPNPLRAHCQAALGLWQRRSSNCFERKIREARRFVRCYGFDMKQIDRDFAFAAFDRRDRSVDGQFIGAVRTTGIYCKPSCPARRPNRENVEFFGSAAEARAAGYRACLRCRPDDVGRDRAAVAKAIALIDASETAPALNALAGSVGYAPHHFHRLFKRETGLTPAEYTRARRAKQADSLLMEGSSITEAIYEAGYSGPSRYYAEASKRLGMTPSAWMNGGAGVTIRYAIPATTLRPMLVAVTAKGICRLSFDEGDGELRHRFPNAVIQLADEAAYAIIEAAVHAVEHPRVIPDLPLDVAGTAFQQAVWRELQQIPPGQTRTYAQIAAAVGKPNAVRAAGTANGQNQVAVLIPCHRVIRTDGSLGGYAYGLERKAKLLERERQ